MDGESPGLILGVTTGHALGFLRGQTRYMTAAGFRVTILAPESEEGRRTVEVEGGHLLGVRFTRELTPFSDLGALWRVMRILRTLRPAVVNAGTPKAGLLVTVAAKLCGVKARIYTLRGLRFETERGVKRALLLAMERLAARCAHRVVCISESLREAALAARIAPAAKMVVLGAGSSNGVDLERFGPTPDRDATGQRLRAEQGISMTAPVVLFVGRLARDKGIGDLAEAWELVRARHPDSVLVLVGPEEQRDTWSEPARRVLVPGPTVRLAGRQEDPAPWYAMAAQVVLPSWREGFGNVLLEGAAMGRPTVATNVPGCRDAVQDGVTGTLVPPRDPRHLAAAIIKYLDDPALASAHGAAGRRRAETDFSPTRVWGAQLALYRELLHQGVR